MQQESLRAQTKNLLRRADLRARKGLGQHFLVAVGVLRRIIAAADLTPDDTVIEVGPGLGVLTRELARNAGKVIAVELDDNLAALLKQSFSEMSNVQVINADILKIDPTVLLAGQKDYKVVANLPYYITAPVLRYFLEAHPRPKLMVVMVQKEVARTIVAKPGECSLLSVAVQFYGKPRIVAKVPSRAFHPVPGVDSALLRIDVYPQPAVPMAEKEFFTLVRAGFTSPRKQVVNSLAQGLNLPKSEVLTLLAKTGISPQRRAETFTIEEWTQLCQMWLKGVA